MNRSTVLRVSRREPCPICGHPDWCRVSPDGRFVLCNRIDSGRPAQGKGGGWLHWVDGAARPPQPVHRDAHESPRATSRACEAAWDGILDQLTLTPLHREHLRARGMDDVEITHRRYRSMDGNRAEVVHKIRNRGIDTDGVPGFYRKANPRGVEYWTVAGPPGILIPVRDAAGMLSGMQIRADEPLDGRKYVWLSSRDMPGGCSSGAPIHVARPIGATRDPRIWLTEGPLKGDIAAERLGAVVVSVPGVNVWESGLAVCKTVSGRGDLDLIVAFDMDAETNPAVNLARAQLVYMAYERGYRVRVASWPAGFKGIDDALTARAAYHLRPGSDVLESYSVYDGGER